MSYFLRWTTRGTLRSNRSASLPEMRSPTRRSRSSSTPSSTRPTTGTRAPAPPRASCKMFCKFLACSFSAVPKRNFARKYPFDSMKAFFKLYKICILLHRCNLKIFAKNRFEKTAIFVKFQQKNCKCRKNCKILSNFKNFSLRIW